MKKFLESLFKREKKQNKKSEAQKSYANVVADGIFASMMIHNEF